MDSQRAINELSTVLQSALGITILFLELWKTPMIAFLLTVGGIYVSTLKLHPSSIAPHPHFFANPPRVALAKHRMPQIEVLVTSMEANTEAQES